MTTTWLKQKTTWAGLALIVTGIGELICGEDVTQAFSHILQGAGLIFLRQAVADIGLRSATKDGEDAVEEVKEVTGKA
ncbi:MAG: hypothetical protein FWC56_06095 [Phycisphaerae bacterium]|nr:hypothetical protein [Phycisphaerae bacterium]